MDVSSNGGIKFIHGEEQDPCTVTVDSCALDVAGRGPHNRDVLAQLLNVTFERVRQIEVRGQAKMAKVLRAGNVSAEDFNAPEG